MDLSSKIKAIRDSLRVSQAEMARRLEVEPPSYHRLENRGEKLSIEQLESIANALGVSMLNILTWGEAKPESQTHVDMAKEVETLKEENNRLEELIDILSEGAKMRRVAAKQLYDQYKDALPLESLDPRLNGFLVRVMFYIRILADIADDSSND